MHAEGNAETFGYDTLQVQLTKRVSQGRWPVEFIQEQTKPVLNPGLQTAQTAQGPESPRAFSMHCRSSQTSRCQGRTVFTWRSLPHDAGRRSCRVLV